jgi:hypothetical protein
MDSWFIKQLKSDEYVSDISANSYTEEIHGSPAGLKTKGGGAGGGGDVEKYQNS